jgi:hypothetical protein
VVKSPTWKDLLERLPKDATFSEEQAIKLLDPHRDSRYRNIVINGCRHPLVAGLITSGHIRWFSWDDRILERVSEGELIPKRPPCRTVYLPRTKEPWKAELDSLREQLGVTAAPIVGPLPDTRKMIQNPTHFEVYSHPLTRSIRAGEIVETDQKTAEAATASGIFVRPDPAKVARLLASR